MNMLLRLLRSLSRRSFIRSARVRAWQRNPALYEKILSADELRAIHQDYRAGY